ncbi:MAG: carbamoyltransferase [Nanoarchaeota archaeon]
MNILGISCYYHDASAVLLKDGVPVAGAQEERFTRKKHDTSFPRRAIQYCLRSQHLSIDDIDRIAFYEKPFLKFERVLYQHLQSFPKSWKVFLSSMPSWLNEKLRVMRAIRKLEYKGDVSFIPHHLAHAASAFLISPYQKAAILTVDGVGEWETTTLGMGEDTDIRLLKGIRFPASIGLLYSTITAYLGFSVNNSEYKVMGLSPYGIMDRKKNPYYEKLLKVVDVKDDGSYRLDMSYFLFHYADRMPSKKLCTLLGSPVNKPEQAPTQRHKDIAAALQMVTEDIMANMLIHLHHLTECTDLVMAGGVALNSVFNGKILGNTPFKRIWIQPDAGDGGASLGAASYVYHSLERHKRNYHMIHAYLGPSYSSKQIEAYFKRKHIHYTTFKDEAALITETAKLLYDNKVIGWFHGGMEWGPRALGARSILANPCNPEAKALLNAKVKHREKFRPFAPVVCVEDAATYFECDEPLPEPTDFMLMVYPVRKEWQTKIPSVTHVDGSGRLQTIRRHQNPLYYDVIKEFGKLSSIPILINTSFNIRGEPIVCTPHDAYRCMMGTGIDVLVIDRFMVERDKNPQDQWDSEDIAKD